MNKLNFLAVMLLPLVAALPAQAECCIPTETIDAMSEADWTAYGAEVFEALVDPTTTNTALMAVIQYGRHLDVERGDVIKLVRIYRDADDVRQRRMSILALHALDDDWGIDFLARSFAHEKDPVLKTTIRAVLLDHAARHGEGKIEAGVLNKKSNSGSN